MNPGASSASPTLSERLRQSLEGWLDADLVDWSCAAAGALEAQLRDCGGICHRELVDPIAAWLSFEEAERAALGSMLDMLQVAIDLADNLADAQEDAEAGRRYADAYEPIPHAVRYCLPAYLVATSREQLERHFFARPEPLRQTCRALHHILGTLVRGQGIVDKAEKARLVSGAQARLLCLPIWLRPDAVTPEQRERLLSWAEAWGTSWELGFEYKERPTREARARWVHSVQEARARWPDFGPFVPGGPLSADLHLVAVC